MLVILRYEIRRQSEILEGGKVVQSETRGFNPTIGHTITSRKKEGVGDYRFMREPDIPPLRVSKELIDRVRGGMKESLEKRREMLVSGHHLPPVSFMTIPIKNLRFFTNPLCLYPSRAF